MLKKVSYFCAFSGTLSIRQKMIHAAKQRLNMQAAGYQKGRKHADYEL